MKKLFRRSSIIILIAILVVSLTYFPSQEVNAEVDESEAINFQRVSVHDPSIIKADNGSYYVFGSHIAAAKSSDLMNWSSLVEREYQTPTNNPIYGDLSANLAESFKWAGEDDADSTGGFSVWAPDIIWNKDFIWEDGSKGAYTLYYSVSSTYIRSAIGIAVSKNIEGPFEYRDTIIYSGFTNYDAKDNRSDVNKHWKNTNLSKLIDNGIIEEPNPNWFTSEGNYNNALYTNAIDANVLYDENGDLWMTYGSWSGGTFILPLDKETGVPIYPGKDGETSDGRMIDRYFGTKIAGGYGRSGEGTYAVYDKESGYYYLYITYGGLAAEGGYQMRQFRSENIDGPYVDAAGNEVVFPESFNIGVGNFPSNSDHKDIGNKMIGNFLFKRDLGEEGTGIGTGYMAPGHNSYLIDEELGKEFIVTHTRFPQQGELHQLRVHQAFKNREGWPVPTPYQYAGETIQAVSESSIIGDYKYINHGKEITGKLTESTWIKLNEDHTISGAVTGTWKLSDNYRVELTVEGATYDGVFIRQYDPTSESWVMTFSAMSGNGTVIWGSHVASKPNQDVVASIKEELGSTIPAEVIKDIVLPTEATQGTKITWASSHPEAISNEGKVTRPTFGSDDASVELTATITLGDAVETLKISVRVLAEEQGGLSAYYDFSNGLADRSENQEDATTTGDRIHNTGGNITFEEGIVGKAAKFDGKSGVKLANGLIASDKYSVSLWLKPEEITEFTTTFFGARTENNWISVVPNAHGVTKVWSHNGDDWYDAVSDAIIPTGEWTHFALTVNEGEAKVYINGVEKFSNKNFPDVFTTVDAQFSLGVNYWDTPYKGLMDEVRVYDGVVLPMEEVKSLYENPDGLTANFDFENNLEDTTGSHNAGNITGEFINSTGGSITYEKGITGQAAVFDGKSGISLPKGLISSNAYSLSLWLNPKEITQHTTTFFGSRNENNWISLVPSGPGEGKTMLWSGSQTWYDATTETTIPTNKWTHLVTTVNNGEVVIYVNGEEAFTGSNFPDIFTTTDAVFGLGVNYWDTPFNGLMDDLRIYSNKVLSASEVEDYYSSVMKEEEPGTEEPGTEEPGTEEPGTEEPGTEEPGTEEPGTEEPGIEEPGTEEPGTEEPGTEEPGTEEPGTEEPGTEEPGTEKPGTEEPGTQDPVKVSTGSTNNSSDSNKQSINNGATLPNTSTNQYNWLTVGLLLVIGGSILIVVRKRKNRID
ncbi:LamG-like jellyroll fold domain-containing protein [Bacillus sp. B1-b2]|uniref:LamG-like jellyroll fold domain-containing protein n=1 Tax=Bacillus sp. B1-b2 TaxID=2653201 RepID=UPI001261CEA2|nr:LamG-like jellyroll fold domain-containing protein [Bacillus sp. B1-b2]KAB7670762.1 family 43 glycosylhydrolase [Bacillus sp. B1-b2]